MNRALLSLRILPLLLTACGGNVVVDPASGGSAGTQGSSASGVGGATGAGGGSGTTTGVSSSASTGAGGSSTGCGVGAFEMTIQGPSTAMDLSLTSSCINHIAPVAVPFGLEVSGSKGRELIIVGCVSAATNSQGVVITAHPDAFIVGTYPSQLIYTDASATMVTVGAGLTISEIGPVGGFVVGSFGAMLPSGDTLAGKFEVCRTPNLIAP
jgi:hypothetical protein